MTFRPGVSGNPNGRPRGSKNTATRLREKLSRELPSILKKLVAMASEGDTSAAKLILDRCLPPLRPVADVVRIPSAQGGTLSERASDVLEAITSGGLPTDVGAMLLSALASTAKAIEVADLVRRLELLEAEKNGTD